MKLDQWLSDDRITPLVDLSQIDRVPVTFVIPIDDEVCAPELHEAWFAAISAPDSYIRYERGGHGIFWYKSGNAFLRRMVQTIESGTVEKHYEGETSSFIEMVTTHII